MDITIKADVGQEVYYLDSGTIKKGQITEISRFVKEGRLTTIYKIAGTWFNANRIGLTVDEVLDELRKTAQK